MRLRIASVVVLLALSLGIAVGRGTASGRSFEPLSQALAAPLLQNASSGQPIAFQGILTDAEGNPVPDQSHQVVFSIYDAPTAGGPLWQESQMVDTSNGLFSTLLGITSPDDAAIFANNPETYLGIKVGDDPEMTPPLRLAYSPYALHALNVDLKPSSVDTDTLADGAVTAGKLADAAVTSNKIADEAVTAEKLAPGVAATPMQVAMLRWYDVNDSGLTISTGIRPAALAFDGANIWVANDGSDTVTKLRAADGANLGTFDVGALPRGFAFDGVNIWVLNANDLTLTQMRASDAETLSTVPLSGIPTSDIPRAITFDGSHIWVATRDGSVLKISPISGQQVGSVNVKAFNVDATPTAIAFDGTNVWVANARSNNVTKFRAAGGDILGVFDVGNDPAGLAFDGANIWVANESGDTVTKLRAADGVNLGTFDVGDGPVALAFDGANIWVANNASDSLTKLRATDGADLGTSDTGDGPRALAFDGANIWVANDSSDDVMKK